MTTTSKAAKAIWRELKTAYAQIDIAAAECERRGYGDYDQMSQAMGRYDGLKLAYSVITGLDQPTVASKVVHWYINSKHYTPSA